MAFLHDILWVIMELLPVAYVIPNTACPTRVEANLSAAHVDL